MSVRMSDVQNSSSSDDPAMASVHSLRARFEMIGQGANGTADSPTTPSPVAKRSGRPSSPALRKDRPGSPSSPWSKERASSPTSPTRSSASPGAKRAPPRPPLPAVDKSRNKRTSDTAPSSPEATSPVLKSVRTHYGNRSLPQHQLEKSRSKGVEDTQDAKVEREGEVDKEEVEEEEGGEKKGVKKKKEEKKKEKKERERKEKEKKEKEKEEREKAKKQRSKEETDGGDGGKSKFHSLFKAGRSSSTEGKDSIKSTSEESTLSSEKSLAGGGWNSTEKSGDKESGATQHSVVDSGKSGGVQNKKGSPEFSGKNKKASPDLSGKNKKAPPDLSSKNKKASPDLSSKNKKASPDLSSKNKKASPDLSSKNKASPDLSSKNKKASPDLSSKYKASPVLSNKNASSPTLTSKNNAASPDLSGKNAKGAEVNHSPKGAGKKLKKSESHPITQREEGAAKNGEEEEEEREGEEGKKASPRLRKSKSSVGASGRDSEGMATQTHRSPQGTRRREALNTEEEAKKLREAAILAAEKELTAAKLEPILKKELAYLTSGLEGECHQIVVVMETGLKLMESPSGFEEFKTTLAYFRVLLSPDQVSNGVTLLIDTRSTSTHKAAKHLLEKLAEDTSPPLPLYMIYILLKTSLFSFGRKSLVSSDAASRLHLAYLNDPKQAVDQLGGENVLKEMGGTLEYCHGEWVSSRLDYEKMVHLHKKTLQRLPETKDALDRFDVPSTVKDAENLMQGDLGLKEKMINLFAESELKMDQFLGKLRERQSKEEKVEVEVMMLSVEKMMKEIKARQSEFDQFWKLHRARVEHMMSMCHFNRSTEKLKRIMQGHIDDLSEDKVVLGDNLEAALEQGEKHEAFATKCMETMDEQMTKIREDAAILCSPSFGSAELEQTMHAATQKAVEAVRQQLQEITKTYETLANVCQKKRELFIICVKFHMKMRQVQQWNEEILELLASQPLEEPSPSSALSLLSKIEQWIMKMPPTELSNLKELSATLPGKTFKKRYESTVKKYDHTRNLLEQRKQHLQKILTSHFPSPLAPPSPQSQHKLSVPGGLNGQNETDLALDSLSQSSTGDSGDGDFIDTESDPGVLRNRQFVFKELVSTEQDYIKDMTTVIDSYYDEMDPESVSIPLRLRGKRDIVFGNLLDIKNFHEELFIKTLEKYSDNPERIGECFTQHTMQFQMYSLYCKNRTSSETLINETTESQAFFKGIQLKLGHALHLNSYLLKPIQRITKYQLLLKDMMKQASHAKRAHSDLQRALETMLKVLKNLNDSLHVIGLKGFPGSLAEQGRLLVHDMFQVSCNAGRFSRSRERHVFLFEKMVIITKRIEAPVQKRERKSDAYVYKDHVTMAEVGVREAMDKHGQQFQIIIHGQNKAFTFQASTRQVKDMWVREIRRVLQAQFMLMKDVVFKSGTLDRSNYKDKSRLGDGRRDSRLFGDSFKASAHRANAKKSLAGRFFNRKRALVKRQDPRGKKSLSVDPLTSLPVGVGHHAVHPAHSLQLTSGEDSRMLDSTSMSEDASVSSDEEIAFSSEEEDGLETTAVDHYESMAPGAPRYYTATADYDPGPSDNGVKLSTGQEIEVIGINKYGWWWVRSSNHYTNEVEEGWVPASYLHVSADQTMPGMATQPRSGKLSGLRSRDS